MNIDNLSTPLVGQAFSLPRLAAYIRLFAAQNRGRLLLYAFLIPVAFAIIFLLPFSFGMLDNYASHLQSMHNGYPPVDPMTDYEIGFTVILSTVFAFLGASMMFDSLRGKRQAFDTLSMPVSALERFAVYFVVYIVLPWIIALLSAWVVDIVRVTLLHVFTNYGPVVKAVRPWQFFAGDMWDGGIISEKFRFWLVGVSMILLNQAFFALGSIVFNKLAFIKTVAVLVVLQIVLSMMAGFSFLFFVGVPSGPRAWVKNIDFSGAWVSWTMMTVSLVLLVAVYKVIYMRSKESEIIHRW